MYQLTCIYPPKKCDGKHFLMHKALHCTTSYVMPPHYTIKYYYKVYVYKYPDKAR